MEVNGIVYPGFCTFVQMALPAVYVCRVVLRRSKSYRIGLTVRQIDAGNGVDADLASNELVDYCCQVCCDPASLGAAIAPRYARTRCCD